MDLSDFLNEAGYQRIALSRSAVGHFHASGLLNQHSVSVLFDTGAASTIISLSLAQAFELSMTKLPYQGGGAGNARMDIYQVAAAVLRIEDLVLRPRAIVAMDLSHVNQALALKGEQPVDVIVGVDIFEAHAAVIDYASSSLFLKP